MAALQRSLLKSNAECPTLSLTPLSPHCNISSHLIAALPLSAELDLFLSSSLKATVCVFHYVCQDVLAWTFPGRSLFCYFFFKPLRKQVQECSLLGKAFNLRDFSQDSWVNQSVPSCCVRTGPLRSGQILVPTPNLSWKLSCNLNTHVLPRNLPQPGAGFLLQGCPPQTRPTQTQTASFKHWSSRASTLKRKLKAKFQAPSGSPVQLLWQAGFTQYSASQNSFMITRKMSSLYLS